MSNDRTPPPVSFTKYLWIDLEMTGLDVEMERIIEVGAIITDTELNEISNFHAAIKQPQQYFDNMDEWNQTHHEDSGLIDLIKKEGQSEKKVEADLVEWCQTHFGDEKIILAGNTIGQDRVFLKEYFRTFFKMLHYRQLDVTSWKLPFLTSGIWYEKQNSHRAIDDIRESISEFKFLWSYVDKQKLDAAK